MKDVDLGETSNTAELFLSKLKRYPAFQLISTNDDKGRVALRTV